MATFEVMKKSLETLEKNVKVSKKLLEERVNSLDEMKRNRQEAATEEDRRELKIAIEPLRMKPTLQKSLLERKIASLRLNSLSRDRSGQFIAN